MVLETDDCVVALLEYTTDERVKIYLQVIPFKDSYRIVAGSVVPVNLGSHPRGITLLGTIQGFTLPSLGDLCSTFNLTRNVHRPQRFIDAYYKKQKVV